MGWRAIDDHMHGGSASSLWPFFCMPVGKHAAIADIFGCCTGLRFRRNDPAASLAESASRTGNASPVTDLCDLGYHIHKRADNGNTQHIAINQFISILKQKFPINHVYTKYHNLTNSACGMGWCAIDGHMHGRSASSLWSFFCMSVGKKRGNREQCQMVQRFAFSPQRSGGQSCRKCWQDWKRDSGTFLMRLWIADAAENRLGVTRQPKSSVNTGI